MHGLYANAGENIVACVEKKRCTNTQVIHIKEGTRTHTGNKVDFGNASIKNQSITKAYPPPVLNDYEERSRSPCQVVPNSIRRLNQIQSSMGSSVGNGVL